MYSVEQKNGVRGCYGAGSCWHTVFLHSTVEKVIEVFTQLTNMLYTQYD